ncbi:hypothetical protein GCM10018785_37570 [Streptomyces longispororuber]|uniref:DUF397 domain-containing protein n=1 Tax=Streptomyces longispororuber TaxID=68230 RepID=A0A918ZSI6_9ACTN|nr:DUF397 domain-containing protein [Streptomyces longispororuber]GHE65209.1 hypothetical protein GCM10018785_37570 [Streptomyces longispororuber]
MNTRVNLADAHWITSSHSSGEGQCVEVAAVPGAVATRDSKDRTGPVLVFTGEGWDSFIRGLTADEFRC